MTKILIVDDDVETTTILESILKLEGYDPVSVNDSTVAIEKAGPIKPDIFLLDLMMPVLDGFKLCRQLREHPNFFRTPIIIITALDNTDSRIVACSRCVQCGHEHGRWCCLLRPPTSLHQ